MRTALALCAVLLLAYAAFLRLAPPPAQRRMQSAAQENQDVLERYLRSADPPPVVVVGSSMARKLDLTADTCAANLALTGESSLTGLAALSRLPRKPRLVLVEANVADREPDERLVAAAAGPPIRLSRVFLTANKPANLGYSYLYQLKRDKSDPPVTEAAFRGALEIQRDTYARPLEERGLERRIAYLAQRVQELERAGSRVALFELPVYPELEETPLARQVRSALRARLPDNQWISYEELAAGQAIRTLDGIHLDSREAAGVVGQLRARYAPACTAH
jgi:hypothetical protein